MALSLQGLQAKKRNQVVAIDLGSRVTKAVHVQRKGTGYELLGYAALETPPAERGAVGAATAEHLKKVMQALGARQRQVVLALGVSDCLIKQAEVPPMPAADLRLMLKHNAKNILQRDLPDHVFDCWALAVGAKPGTAAGKPGQKVRVLVGAARRQVIADLQAAAKGAGLALEMIVPGQVGPANAFELAQPTMFAQEVVALVDIGYKHTTILVLLGGELALSREVQMGAEKLTTGLAESLGVSAAEAEAMKLAMSEDVQMTLMPLLVPLGREVRASLDFFEHQHDKPVARVFVSGGTARAEFIVKTLREELLLETAVWNPASFMTLALPPQQAAEIEQVAPQLTVATGAALAAL